RFSRDWSSDVCSSDLDLELLCNQRQERVNSIEIGEDYQRSDYQGHAGTSVRRRASFDKRLSVHRYGLAGRVFQPATDVLPVVTVPGWCLRGWSLISFSPPGPGLCLRRRAPG